MSTFRAGYNPLGNAHGRKEHASNFFETDNHYVVTYTRDPLSITRQTVRISYRAILDYWMFDETDGQGNVSRPVFVKKNQPVLLT